MCIRDRESKPFFAIVSNDLRDFLYSGKRQKRSCRLALRGIHSHVEWRIEAKAEASPPLIELRRRHSNIQKHAIHSINPCLPHDHGKLAEMVVRQGQSLIVDFIRCHRLRVAIQRQ